MKIKITTVKNKGKICRRYKARIKSKRNFNPEKGVLLKNYNLNWKFIDTKLGFPVEVDLTEKVSGEDALVIADVVFDKKDFHIHVIDKDVKKQFELLKKWGMVKL